MGGHPWSDGDDGVLITAWKDGESIAAIATTLGRSVNSITLRAKRLSLRRSSRKMIRPAADFAGNTRAIEIATAGEMIVCADIILSGDGRRAFLSSAGLPYDVIAEINGRFLRVGVKSTLVPRERSTRPASRACYQFTAQRPRKSRAKSGPLYEVRPYSDQEIDLMAFVALDIRRVAYVPVIGVLMSSWHLDAPGARTSRSIFGPKLVAERKTFENLSLESALAAKERLE